MLQESLTMIKQPSQITLLMLLLVALVSGCDGPVEETGPGDADSVSFVMITIDALVAEELSAFDGPKATPALSELAEAGLVMRDGWTVTPMTRPAVATYLTGLAPDRHGVRDDLFTSLAPEIPTLTERLAERGYRTAAFPGSSLLGYDSGLLRGFEIVDEPPRPIIWPGRWLSLHEPAEETATNFEAWLDGVPVDEPFFAWLHFPQYGLTRLAEAEVAWEAAEKEGAKAKRAKKRLAQPRESEGEEDAALPGIDKVDDALGRIVKALNARGDASRTLIVVAGTLGDVVGDGAEPVGPGYSLADGAVRVPLIARFPASVDPVRENDSFWSPDVPATVAALAGVELSPAAEGLSLLAPADDERILFSWSWAPLDQAGWSALRAARKGAAVLLEDRTGETMIGSEDEAVEAELREALAERDEPPDPPRVPPDEILPILVGLGLDPQPRSMDPPADPDEAREAVRALWRARISLAMQNVRRARRLTAAALRRDPGNLAARLDRAHLLVLTGDEETAREVLAPAVEAAPTRPVLLHWYAHALWSSDTPNVAALLEAILPYSPEVGDVQFDLACTHSMEGDVAESERRLRLAIEAGYRDWQNIETVASLRNLRESGRFAEVMREYGR
jgi:Tfp pilus assembly protein PilF